MRRRQRQVGRPSIPCYQKRVNDWRRRMEAISKEIQAEYDSLSMNPPTEPATTVFYAEDLTTAIMFMKRAEERLIEYQNIRERNAAWEEAMKRRK